MITPEQQNSSAAFWEAQIFKPAVEHWNLLLFSKFSEFLSVSAGLCLKMHQELWTKALASQLFTDKTAASCQMRTCSNCSLTSESMSFFSCLYKISQSLVLILVFVIGDSISVSHNRPEKMAKLPVLLGNLDITIDSVAPDVTSKPSKYLQNYWPDYKKYTRIMIRGDECYKYDDV